MSLGKHSASKTIRVIPTGALSLDIALGIGGVPRGRIVEIYGPESSGKSTLATHILKIAEYNSRRRKGVSHDEALKVATSIPFLWKLNKMDAQTRNFGEHEVRHALTLLTDAESMLKKYSVDKRLMAEILIPLVTRGKAGRG